MFGAVIALLWGVLPGLGYGAAPSSYSSADDGIKALYFLLGDLGYSTARVFGTQGLDQTFAAALMLDGEPLVEQTPLAHWVTMGGLLLVAAPTHQEGAPCPELKVGATTLKRQAAALPQQHFALNGLKFKGARCRFTSLPSSVTALAGSPDNILAVDLAWEKGRLLVLADERLVTNVRLDGDDLAVVIRRWLAQYCPMGGRIAFVETPQGGQFLDALRRAGLTLFALHGLLFLMLLYWSLIHRFGDPVAEPTTSRRAFVLHARALGHLYQHRGASAHVLKMQYQRFLARLFGSSRCNPQRARAPEGRLLGKDRGAIAALIATRTGRDADGVESLLAQIEYTLKSPDAAETKDQQKHLRLGQALAALDSAHTGGYRGPKYIR